MRNDDIEVFKLPPVNFKNRVTFVGCYCRDHSDRILLLKRNPDRPLGGRWGIPGGKPEGNEMIRQTLRRELEEETGIIVNEELFEELATVYVRHSEADVTMYRFQIRFLKPPKITLKDHEHSEAQWFSREEALQLPNVTGGVRALQLF